MRVPVERGTGRVSQARTAGSTLGLVDTKQEIREFLTSRRARITPEQAGPGPPTAAPRPGLRREEVAVLAGVSVPYYTRLERGDLSGVSESVLEALARALQLDDAERAHLFDLARAAQPTPARPRRRQSSQRVRPEVQRTLDAITGAAAFVSNERLDILAANQLGLRCSPSCTPRRRGRSTPPGSSSSTREPRRSTATGTASPPNPSPSCALPPVATRTTATSPDLVGELATQSEAFRTRWAAHNVRFHNTGVKHFHHPVVGELHLSYDRLDLAADPGLTIFTYTAEPGSPPPRRPSPPPRRGPPPPPAGPPPPPPPARGPEVMGGARLEQAASCFRRKQVLRSRAACC